MPLMPNLNSLYLEDTNLTDIGFSIILKSIEEHIRDFKSITYKGVVNQFGQKSLNELTKILKRPVPFQLTTLVFESIRLLPSFPIKLIEAITHKSLLEKLSLANMKLDRFAFRDLCLYLNRNYSLKDLNLKMMNLPVRIFAAILPILSKNCKL